MKIGSKGEVRQKNSIFLKFSLVKILTNGLTRAAGDRFALLRGRHFMDLSLRFDYLLDNSGVTPEESIDFQRELLGVEAELQAEKKISYKDFVFLCDLPSEYFNNTQYTIDPTLPVAYNELLKRNPDLKTLVEKFNNKTEAEQTALETSRKEKVSSAFSQGGGWQKLTGAVCVIIGGVVVFKVPGLFKLLSLAPIGAGVGLWYWGSLEGDKLNEKIATEMLQQIGVTDTEIRFEMVN